MKKISTFIYIIVVTLLLSCQPQGDSFVKLNIEDGTVWFLGHKMTYELSSSVDIESVTIKFMEKEQKLDGDQLHVTFDPQELANKAKIEVVGFDKEHKEVANSIYRVKIVHEPVIDVESPTSHQSISIDEEFFLKGSFDISIASVDVVIGNKVVATFDHSPFNQSFSFERGRGETPIDFVFKDVDGDTIVTKTVTVDLLNDTQSSVPLYDRPWLNPDSSIVIDAYEGNYINWDKMATDHKMVGVIHRAADGLRVDKKYKERRKIAKERGYLWGAYHLGRPGNVKQQAELFLSLVDDETLLILDLESFDSSSMMGANDAVAFMNYVYDKTGKIPVIYGNHSVTKAINARLADNPLFKQSALWYARFRSTIPDFPVGVWDQYFLWQFSSEINCSHTGSCLYNVPGTGFDMDINVYPGTKAELENAWYRVN